MKPTGPSRRTVLSDYPCQVVLQILYSFGAHRLVLKVVKGGFPDGMVGIHPLIWPNSVRRPGMYTCQRE